MSTTEKTGSMTAEKGPEKALEKPQEKNDAPFQANHLFLIPFAITMNLGCLLFGYMLGECNQMFPILVVLFEWNEEEANLYTSLIAAFGLVGGVFGSLYGGRLLQQDRRKALVAINLTGILGATLCTI
mmetsp:Transcript_18953/g.18099  ORF Transcript_18953/g.18099 Transcript_18953/m.18099 type:complete len:128 (+) Transcript_18953:1-384(+)